MIAVSLRTSFAIWAIVSPLGAAGSEFPSPSFVLSFGADIKLTGGLSLAVSLPTMLVVHPLWYCSTSRFSLRRLYEVVLRG